MTNIYDNGKIYKIQCCDGHYYIGSTTQKLNHRLSNHKQSAKSETSKVYNYINLIGWDNVQIELIEDYPCSKKSELNEREDYHIRQSKEDELCLNINSAQLTDEKRKEQKKEYYEANKEAIIEKTRKYVEKNREVVDKKRAQYRKENAKLLSEKQKQYALENKEKIVEARKQYNKENKDRIREYWKEYNNKEENKEKIRDYKRKSAQKMKELNKDTIVKKCEEKKQVREEKKQARIAYDRTIIQCSCGGSYQNYRKNRHDESKKHQSYINTLS